MLYSLNVCHDSFRIFFRQNTKQTLLYRIHWNGRTSQLQLHIQLIWLLCLLIRHLLKFSWVCVHMWKLLFRLIDNSISLSGDVNDITLKARLFKKRPVRKATKIELFNTENAINSLEQDSDEEGIITNGRHAWLLI